MTFGEKIDLTAVVFLFAEGSKTSDGVLSDTRILFFSGDT